METSASRACSALRVVLQHWMVPDLGWHLGIFLYRLTKLRNRNTDIDGTGLITLQNSVSLASMLREELTNRNLESFVKNHQQCGSVDEVSFPQPLFPLINPLTLPLLVVPRKILNFPT